MMNRDSEAEIHELQLNYRTSYSQKPLDSWNYTVNTDEWNWLMMYKQAPTSGIKQTAGVIDQVSPTCTVSWCRIFLRLSLGSSWPGLARCSRTRQSSAEKRETPTTLTSCHWNRRLGNHFQTIASNEMSQILKTHQTFVTRWIDSTWRNITVFYHPPCR